MSEILKVSGVWKEYVRGGEKAPYKSLRDSLRNGLRSKGKKTPFWALQEVDFSVEEGESLAIIGHNGAGKSTLLKILSRITPPTKGSITLHGRLASLLEVGTGFHPELTGRENIYLNGSVLGLTKREIDRQFDAIVDFSGVEAFIETPLKHFSSGMQLRLAFAVAAHLEPEILVIDEVLAVGDTAFQQKCIRKMTEVRHAGRTLLFVSHNLNAVRSLCSRAIMLEQGKITAEGAVNDVIDAYHQTSSVTKRIHSLSELEKRQGNGPLRFKEVRFSQEVFDVKEAIEFTLSVNNPSGESFEEVEFGVAIRDKDNLNLIHLSNKFIEQEITHLNEEYTFRIEHMLRPGIYTLVLFLRCGLEIHDWIQEGIHFKIDREGHHYQGNSSGILETNFTLRQSKAMNR